MELMLDELTQKYFENPIYAKIYLVPFCRLQTVHVILLGKVQFRIYYIVDISKYSITLSPIHTTGLWMIRVCTKNRVKI